MIIPASKIKRPGEHLDVILEKLFNEINKVYVLKPKDIELTFEVELPYLLSEKAIEDVKNIFKMNGFEIIAIEPRGYIKFK